MDIIVKARNCDVPAKLKEETIERLTHATRFYDRLLVVEVVFSEEHNPRIAAPAVVEVTARTKGHHIRAEGSAAAHRDAVEAAAVRFERQLARYKARLVDRHRGRLRHGAAVATNGLVAAPAADPEPDAWPQPQIVRTKRFDLQPMLPEDAALQLELLGHEFFLFTNAASGMCSVVYRRRDGNLGLIESAAAPGPTDETVH